MKLVIWMNYPSHYQSDFFRALRARGVDLRVYYYENVPSDRIDLGWRQGDDLPVGERHLDDHEKLGDVLDQTRHFVHIILPSLGTPLVRRLLHAVVRKQMEWLIWSEPLRPGLRRVLVLPFKQWLGHSVNKHGLGALAIGTLAQAEFLSWGIQRNKIACIPYSAPALSTDAPADELCQAFCEQRKAFSFLGSLCQRKGVDLLLAAFATAHRCPGGENWRLLLVGNDHSRSRYQALARHLEIAGACLFRGPVAADRIAGVMRVTDVLVLPSRFDGWGVVVNEAASAGKALIASDRVGAAHHLIDPAVNGFRVKSGDRSSLSQAMAAYVRCDGLTQKHGDASTAIYSGFTSEQNARRLVSAVESLRALRAGNHAGRGVFPEPCATALAP